MPDLNAAIEPAKSGLKRVLMIGGGALIAVLAVAAIVQIATSAQTDAAKSAALESTAAAEKPGGGAQYGLTRKELGALTAHDLIKRALATSSIEQIQTGARDGDALGQTLLCLAYDWAKA